MARLGRAFPGQYQRLPQVTLATPGLATLTPSGLTRTRALGSSSVTTSGGGVTLTPVGSDNFTRADGAIAGANNWVQNGYEGVGWAIASNLATYSGTGNGQCDKRTGETYGNDQYSEFTVGNLGSLTGFLIGPTTRNDAATPGKFYMAAIQKPAPGHTNPGIGIWISTGNDSLSAALTDTESVITTGDVIRLVSIGSVHTLYLNGVSLVSVTNTSIAAGVPGIFGAGTSTTISHWAGGNAATTTGGGLAPSGLTHTRALGSPVVSPHLGPAGLTRTRTLGTLAVTSVSPHLSPTGLVHTRTLGSSAVVVPGFARPLGLVHTRAVGQPAAGQPGIRQLGSIVVTLVWNGRPPGLVKTRALGTIGVSRHTLTPGGVVHVRAQGSPTVHRGPVPDGLTRTRHLGVVEINLKLLGPVALDRAGLLIVLPIWDGGSASTVFSDQLDGGASNTTFTSTIDGGSA